MIACANLPAMQAASVVLPAMDVSLTGSATGLEGLRLLDQADQWGDFSREVSGHETHWESHVAIEGMHCAACSLTLESVLLAVPGVLSATVSAGSHRACIVWDSSQVQPSVWMSAVIQAGYRAVPALDAFANERRRDETRQALWRWAVAGFCMMQVMMYAWPAYVAAPGDLSPEMEQLLRWASWVLTLPVVFFSCGPFFKAALRDVLQRRISMDLPVALGMIITFCVSTAGTFDPQGIFGREVFFDSLTMFVFFLLTGRWLELRLRERTAGSLDALMNRLPDSVERQTPAGAFERVTARRLQVGDTIRVSAGEVFPADGTLTQGQTQVDEALLTGESRPLARTQGDAVIAGSANLSGAVLMRVDRVGALTRFAQIVSLMQEAALSKPELARLADRIAKPFLLCVLLAAGLACVFWWPTDPERALMVAVAVLIVTCPCALSLATPAAMLASAGALARQGTWVRRLQALEALARVDTFLFDKTGTLTSDVLRVTGIHTRTGVTPQQALGWAAPLAAHSRHPVARAVHARALQALAGSSDGSAVIPNTQWLATDIQESAGQGISGQLMPLGMASQKVPNAEPKTCRLGSAEFCGVSQVSWPASDSSVVCLSDENGWLATFELAEEMRADAKETIALLQKQGIQIQILSGDQAGAVARVADSLGIERAQGACTPDDKLRAMLLAQKAGHCVAVVGDGLNDGPALAGANVSFAFGQAVPLAQAQADFVVLGNSLYVVVQTVLLARHTLRIVHQNLSWALAYNAACIPLAVAGYLPAWLAGLGMAGSSLLVVLNALRLSRPMQTKV
jgi:P-type Cu2+ transporter